VIFRKLIFVNDDAWKFISSIDHDLYSIKMRLLAPWEADLFAVVPATRFDLGYCSIESSMPIRRTVDQLVRVNPGPIRAQDTDVETIASNSGCEQPLE
jgi:hypothetical protein